MLKWILLAVAIVSFVLFAWATVLTYDRARPQPAIFVTKAGAPQLVTWITRRPGLLGAESGPLTADDE